jgi:G6PDH family F420-dependent oxidoreductase
MTEIGIALSLEERTASDVVAAAARAEAAGFTTGWVSDHFHPWNDAQDESPFVWAVLGGIAAMTRTMRWQTGVTCPTVRMHPAIVAQAAATVATLMPGRFRLGVGSGEALNESVLGDRWPRASVRLEMLEEAVHVMRRLWEGGAVSHEGRHYVVEHARLYSLPERPPPVLVSGFHPGSIELAARIGDGFVTTTPDADAIAAYRAAGGRGPTQTSLKCCYGPDREACIDTAHRLWPNAALPGELAQVLPTPAHFEQATELVPRDAIAELFPCGPDPEEHVAAVQEFVDAGYDEVYVAHIGPGHDEFLDFYAREVVPNVRRGAPVRARA